MNCWERLQKLEVADDSKDTVSSRHNRTDAQVNSDCGSTGPAQGQTEKSQPEKGKWTRMLPLMDKVFAVNTRKKEKLRVFQWTISGCINHTPGKAPTKSSLPTQNKGHVFLCEGFFSLLFWNLCLAGGGVRLFVCLFHFVCLFVLIFIFYLCCFVF